VAAGFAAAAVLLFGLFDAWTRGEPFASLEAFLRLSRDPRLGGFRPRPWYWYGAMTLQWAGPLLIALAAVGAGVRRAFVPLALAASAVVLLSVSPLKQMRYLEIAIPFLAMAAALGWERLEDGTPRSRWIAAAALFVAAPIGLERTLHVLRGKSQAAVRAAGMLSGLRPAPRVVALEQEWAYGGRLYFGNGVVLRDLPPRRPLDAATVGAAAAGADAVALYREDVDAPVREALSMRGLRLCATIGSGPDPAVMIFLPADRPCPAVGAADRSTQLDLDPDPPGIPWRRGILRVAEVGLGAASHVGFRAEDELLGLSPLADAHEGLERHRLVGGYALHAALERPAQPLVEARLERRLVAPPRGRLEVRLGRLAGDRRARPLSFLAAEGADDRQARQNEDRRSRRSHGPER
jgi:hypothetical protein